MLVLCFPFINIYIYIYFLLESRLAADHLLEGQELERETPGSGEVVNM